MSHPGDIDQLFGQFGGDTADYHEIGRENEARTARSRWPLLVGMNLEQPSIPAIGDAPRVCEVTPQQDGTAPAPAGQSQAQPATRSDRRPLFALLSQRPASPVAVKPVAGELGASRFGAPPTALEVPADVAPSPAIAPASVMQHTAAPAAAPVRTIGAPLESAMRSAATATPSVPESEPEPPRVARQPAVAARTADAPAPILRKLFTPPAAGDDEPSSRTATPLAAVFARLRGDAHEGQRTRTGRAAGPNATVTRSADADAPSRPHSARRP